MQRRQFKLYAQFLMNGFILSNFIFKLAFNGITARVCDLYSFGCLKFDETTCVA